MQIVYVADVEMGKVKMGKVRP
eukprot:SAG22_NODE_11560_length_479_cov_0.815789_1_plen_21_part_10